MSIRIVLVGTTHAGNIGAVARAMKNMGLTELVLVNPRVFPHEDAVARASGAEDVLDAARVVDSLQTAIADCVFVAGASARSRSIGWPGLAPRACAARLVEESTRGNVALVFGPEKSGLTNDDLDRCQVLLTIPANPEFSSLNIAMAVQVMTYEWRLAMGHDLPAPDEPDVPAATSQELEHFYHHLESVMTTCGFLDPDNPRHLMRRLRRLFIKAKPDQNEINMLRGFLTSIDPARPSAKK